MISVTNRGEYFEVVVSESVIRTQQMPDGTEAMMKEDSSTTHKVTLDEETHKKLGKGRTKEEFLEDCFKFLLERESKESILKEFNVKIIGKYFPEWEKVI